jgi:NADH dehydrogenase
MILVAGGTGVLGGLIVHRLLGQSERVRVLLRHSSPAEGMAAEGLATAPSSLIRAGAEAVYGDLKELASLETACDGVDTVITTANSAMRGGDDTVDSVDLNGNRSLIEAAKAAGVQQFVFTSFLGASLDSPVPLFQAKAKTEEVLRTSGMDHTILAPNWFMESWLGTVVGMPLQAGAAVTIVGEGARRHSFISVGDVAAFAAAAVGHPAAINQRLALGGPEPLSWRAILATCERVLGQPIPVQLVAPGEPIPGLPEAVPAVLASMEAYESPVPMEDTAQTFGVELTSLEQVVQRTFGR